eukprot:1004109-Prorocentrum_minimum.AAC.3
MLKIASFWNVCCLGWLAKRCAGYLGESGQTENASLSRRTTCTPWSSRAFLALQGKCSSTITTTVLGFVVPNNEQMEAMHWS